MDGGLTIPRGEWALLLLACGGYLAVVVPTGVGEPRGVQGLPVPFAALVTVAVTVTAIGWFHRSASIGQPPRGAT